jgi:aminoglycoside phosphotransferase (APT) family kinase protein
MPTQTQADAKADTQADARAGIQRVVEHACPGIGIKSLSRLDAGYSSKHWVADTDEGRLLVKVPQRNKDPEHLRRLMASTRVAAEHGIPVVRYRRLVAHDPTVNGPVLIQEFHQGETVGDLWDSLDDGGRKALCHQLGDIVGRVHGIIGPEFGPVLGGGMAPTLREAVEVEVDTLLSRADAEMLGERAALRVGIATALSRLDGSASVPALIHGDLWWPNFLVRDGRLTCTLDFEHAAYADRFRDFGKLDEHIFDKFPAGREVFLESYAAACPLPDDWQERLALGHVLHALTMHVYFLRWSPQWAPQYARQAGEWLAERADAR